MELQKAVSYLETHALKGTQYLPSIPWASITPNDPGRTSWWFGLLGSQFTGPAFVAFARSHAWEAMTDDDVFAVQWSGSERYAVVCNVVMVEHSLTHALLLS